MTDLHFGSITGLTVAEEKQLHALAEVFNYHQPYNDTKDKYYEGHITLDAVNIGIALPGGIKKLEVGCNWGQKTVDVLAARSMFDGFVGKNTEALTQLVADNRLIAEYSKACRDELKYGCAFATLSASGSTAPPQRRLCGAVKKGASTAGWPSLTPCRMSSSRGAGCRTWSTCTPTTPSLCWNAYRANGRPHATPTAWAAR